MTTWEGRMAWRASLRRDAAETARQQQEAAEKARLDAEFPAVPGEHDNVETEGPHRGHRTHTDPWHGNMVVCACGALMGCFSIALDGTGPEPEPCPVCTARGIPVDR